MIKFEISPSTDTSLLADELGHPEIEIVLYSLQRSGSLGWHTVEIDTDFRSDPKTELRVTGSDITAVYFPESGRAAIADESGVNWTDAHSVKDAIELYWADEMVA